MPIVAITIAIIVVSIIFALGILYFFTDVFKSKKTKVTNLNTPLLLSPGTVYVGTSGYQTRTEYYDVELNKTIKFNFNVTIPSDANPLALKSMKDIKLTLYNAVDNLPLFTHTVSNEGTDSDKFTQNSNFTMSLELPDSYNEELSSSAQQLYCIFTYTLNDDTEHDALNPSETDSNNFTKRNIVIDQAFIDSLDQISSATIQGHTTTFSFNVNNGFTEPVLELESGADDVFIYSLSTCGC